MSEKRERRWLLKLSKSGGGHYFGVCVATINSFNTEHMLDKKELPPEDDGLTLDQLAAKHYPADVPQPKTGEFTERLVPRFS